MKVKDLKKVLDKADDEATVVIPSFDHTYVEAEVTPNDIAVYSRTFDVMHEYFSDNDMESDQEKISVVVIN